MHRLPSWWTACGTAWCIILFTTAPCPSHPSIPVSGMQTTWQGQLKVTAGQGTRPKRAPPKEAGVVRWAMRRAGLRRAHPTLAIKAGGCCRCFGRGREKGGKGIINIMRFVARLMDGCLSCHEFWTDGPRLMRHRR